MIQQTSIDAYNAIKSNGLLSRKRFEVYEEIFKHQPISIDQLIRNLGKPGFNTGSISGRISELVELGVIRGWGTAVNPATGREVILWATTDGLPIKPPPRESMAAKVARLEAEVLSLKQENERLRHPLMRVELSENSRLPLVGGS